MWMTKWNSLHNLFILAIYHIIIIIAKEVDVECLLSNAFIISISISEWDTAETQRASPDHYWQIMHRCKHQSDPHFQWKQKNARKIGLTHMGHHITASCNQYERYFFFHNHNNNDDDDDDSLCTMYLYISMIIDVVFFLLFVTNCNFEPDKCAAINNPFSQQTHTHTHTHWK